MDVLRLKADCRLTTATHTANQRSRGNRSVMVGMMQSVHPSLFNPGWGTPVERERRRRIRLALYAYAYEIEAAPMVDDATFDALAQLSAPAIRTGRHDLWWRENFDAHTAQWIHAFPDLDGIAQLYERIRQ
jgi:hypothetical protein